jgi:hypothetical protein
MDVMLGLPGGKPPIGGWLPPVRFTPAQAAVLNAAADQLIPGGEGYPAPSEVDVLSFVAKYVAPAGSEPRWYPFLGEADFGARLDALGTAFAEAVPERQVEVLQILERDDPEFFTRLRDLVYYAYYSRPAVITVMNRRLEAAKDYRLSPLPYGYSDVMADWDDELLSRVRGTYRRTEDVVRLPLPADLAGTQATPEADGTSATGNPLPDSPLATVTP